MLVAVKLFNVDSMQVSVFGDRKLGWEGRECNGEVHGLMLVVVFHLLM